MLESLNRVAPSAITNMHTCRTPEEEDSKQKVLKQLSSNLGSTTLYPDEKHPDYFIAGDRNNERDASFILERDPLFFDGTVRLADGTSVGKQVEIKSGELYIPFFAISKDEEEIPFYLPNTLIQKAKEKNYLLPLLINGKEVQFSIQPDGDCRFFDKIDTTEETIVDIYGKEISTSCLIPRVSLADIIARALSVKAERRVGNTLYGYASTPVLDKDQLKYGKMLPIFRIDTFEETPLDKVTITHAVKAQGLTFSEPIFEKLTPFNWDWGRSTLYKFPEQSHQLRIEMTGLSGNDLFGAIATKHEWLRRDDLVILKHGVCELKEGQEMIENNEKKFQLTLFNFSKYGITFEQMQKATESYEDGVLILHIPAQA